MLLLKLTLVVLTSVIGERALCTDSGTALQAKEKEKEFESLLQKVLMTDTSNGCTSKLLPYFENVKDNGFLAVNCTKSCQEDKQEKVVDGNECIVTLQSSDGDEVKVEVGSCDNGSCKPKSSPKYITVTLTDAEEEEEDEDGKREEGEAEKEE
uniref:Putative secreted protein n=1 Tax=Ixodes ricinus TaxID=34613 RepID=A0A090XES4_IXORI